MRFAAILLAAVCSTSTFAQEPPRPGPQHEQLKKQVGEWSVVMKAQGQEFKGTTVNKLELGGLWLVSDTKIDMGGMPFAGKGMDTYDPAKKKYVGYWFDSMGTTAMQMEGDFDAATKTLTSTGKGPGPDGKVATWKSVVVLTSDKQIDAAMYVGEDREPMFTIVYTRK